MAGRRRRLAGFRVLLACGSLLGVSLAYTGSAVVTTVEGQAVISADRDFDVMVAGYAGDTDEAFDWVQGNPDAYAVAADPAPFGPGDERIFTVGVLNSSPDLAGTVALSVVDPDPVEEDMFDLLEFTLVQGDEVLLDAVSGSDRAALENIGLGHFDPGSSTRLRLSVRLSPEAGNEAMALVTSVRLDVRGVSS